MATAVKIATSLQDRAASHGIGIAPSTPTIGAEISGIDLGQKLSDPVAEIIRDAWLHHKVIFFRDQDIDYAAHIRLGRLFGELEGHPVIPHVEGHPEVLIIRGVEGVQLTAESFAPFKAYNKWHTDVTFRERPSIASVLRARLLPELGGDTIWADTAAAYDGLPQAVKDRIAGLDAEHDIIASFGGRVTEEKRAQLALDFPAVTHPVVRTHPETGEKILYVNYTFTTRIVGIPEEESKDLLRLLTAAYDVPNPFDGGASA